MSAPNNTHSQGTNQRAGQSLETNAMVSCAAPCHDARPYYANTEKTEVCEAHFCMNTP